MTPSLSHHRHFSNSLQFYDTPKSEIDHSEFQDSYKDFGLFDDSLDQPTPSSHIAGPLDLSFLRGYREDLNIESRDSTPYDSSFSPLTDLQSVQGPFSPNPRLRAVQRATATSTGSTSSTPPPMHEGGSWAQGPWSNVPDNDFLSPRSTHSMNTPQSFGGHKRLSSESSVGSTGPDSPYTQNSSYPLIFDSETHSNSSPRVEPVDGSNTHYYPQFDKLFYHQQPSPLTPYPVSGSFRNLHISDPSYHMMGGQQGARGSVSSNGQDYGAGAQNAMRRSRGDPSNMYGSSGIVPKFERTTTDAFADTLMGSAPSTQPRAQQGQHAGQHHLSPHHNDMFNAVRQRAEESRSKSPATMPYDLSPFSNYSSEIPVGQSVGGGMPSPAGNTGNPRTAAATPTSSQIRARPQAEQQLYHRTHHPAGAATISPKEAVLDSTATLDAKLPPSSSASTQQSSIKREPGFSSAHAVGQSQFVTNYNSGHGLTDLNSSPHATQHDHSSARFPTPQLPSSSQDSTSPTNQYHIMAPNNAGSNQAYPFISQSRRQSSSMRSGESEVPPFPASLNSMESTKSESSREPNVRPPAFRNQETILSQRSELSPPLSRPADTSANTGAYQCATKGCSARFDTNAKLKKHRRENHTEPPKSPTPSTPRSLSSHTRSSATLVATPKTSNSSINHASSSRNNSTGPFRCERINPGTGRPCNTIFSRSYDLTRHEETIHNNNKKKSKCQICTEDKTFSRHDALTRHMRVVHPDVDFPGRNSKRRP